MRTTLFCFMLCACGVDELRPMPPEVPPTCEEVVGLNVNFEGVYRGPNRHSQVPPGAAERAENLVSYNKGHAECVPGMETLAGTYTTGSERFSSGLPYDSYTIERTNTGALYRRAAGGTLTAVTTGISPPSGVSRVPFAEAGGKLYLATSAGVKVMNGATETPASVGAPGGGLLVATAPAGAGTLLAVNESVAYRATVVKLLPDGTYIESIPSGRAVYTNTGVGADSVTVSVFLPEGLVADDRVRIYRTTIAGTGIDPGDVMYLMSETQLDTAGYALDGSNTVTDNTPDELLGAPLYTNGTQGGIQRQNEQPPLAKVIVGFDDYLLACNVQGPQRFSLRMIGVPADGDTITIDSVVYTFKLIPLAATDVFLLNTGTVSENIAYTSSQLANVINSWVTASPARTVQAAYVSGPSDPPGMLQIEARSLTTAAFSLVSSNGALFEPPLDASLSSSATTEPSGIWVSKRGEHYAFPPLRSSTATYRFRVGTKGRDILAAVPLREAVIVFTNGEGVFKVQRVGTELWRADQINATVQLLIPGSVAVVDNQVIALTTKGIVAIDTGGVEEIDLPIKQAVADILALSSDTLVPYTFAVGDDARNRYILYHPEANSDTTATHAWVYNGTTGTWTERTDDASGGFVDPDSDLLYLGSATSNTLTRERTGTDAQVYKRPNNTAIPVRLEWTVMDDGDPGASKQYTELRLLTEEAITGNVTFNCTNDLGGTESTTAVATSEPFARAWVPDGCQWTSRLKVDIQRSVLSQAFTVVGMKTLVAGMEDGSFTR